LFNLISGCRNTDFPRQRRLPTSLDSREAATAKLELPSPLNGCNVSSTPGLRHVFSSISGSLLRPLRHSKFLARYSIFRSSFGQCSSRTTEPLIDANEREWALASKVASILTEPQRHGDGRTGEWAIGLRPTSDYKHESRAVSKLEATCLRTSSAFHAPS
jgi:hypothetical protein